MVVTSNTSFLWVMVLFTSLYVIQVAESAFMFKIQLSKLVPENGVSYCNFSSVLILG